LESFLVDSKMIYTVLCASAIIFVSGTASVEVPEKLAATYRSAEKWGRNTCSHAFDGDCDDGGPGSEWSLCRADTDAGDCGEDSCSHNFDHDCDDGGIGSEYSFCSRGSDRTDCNRRSHLPSSFSSTRHSTHCSNTCAHSRDGDCDDGGAGSEWSLCAVGTDCSDCPTRHFGYLHSEAEAIEQQAFPSLREQKVAKMGAHRSMSSTGGFAIAGVVGVGALVAVGLISKRRGAPQPETAAKDDAAPML